MRGMFSGEGNPIKSNRGFAQFYEANSQTLLVFFARRTLDSETAMDLTAETFAKALLSRKRFRGGSEDEARAWLYGIANHELSRYFRRGAAEQRAMRKLGMTREELDDEDLKRVDELAGISTLRGSVASVLGELSEAHREVLQLRVVEERDYDEVATELGISEVTARARVSRALKALAISLERQPEFEVGPS